jgi:hypothetical protein
MTHSSSYRQRSGAHRPRRRVAAIAVPLLLVPVVVAALLVGLRLLPPGGSTSSVGTAGGAPSATAPATASGTSSDPAEDGAGTVTDSPSSAPGSPSVSPSSSGSTDVDRSSRVTVLNGTSRAGLATRVADALRSGGWAVGELGNYRESVLTTTVYYPEPNQRATARALSSDLPGTQRVVRSTRFGTGVTVVIGLDYPG